MIRRGTDDTTRSSAWFSRTERLSRAEWISVLVFVAVISSFDIIGLVRTPGGDTTDRVFSLLTTLSLALYVWSPVLATAVLSGVLSVSIISGHVAGTLLGAAVSTFLVVRQASAPLLTAYAGGLLIYIALAVSYVQVQPQLVGRGLFFAVFAGGVGLAFRLWYKRGEQLKLKLLEQAEEQRQAILAERRWIADELHDSIAHHLTIISLHAQLLDDEAMRPTSQEAIRVAARKALTDIRFVIKLAEAAPVGVEVPLGDLAKAIDEARNEFETAGHTTVLEGNPSDEMISRGVDIILAHVVRESATNIIKYAGPGEVRFVLHMDHDAIILEIRSPLSLDGPRVNSSTGTGLNRMAERVLGVSGEFTAGPEDGVWVVSARLPIEAANGAASAHSGSAVYP